MGRWGVAKDVVQRAVNEGKESVCSSEHMFVRLRTAADGLQDRLQGLSGEARLATHAADPNDDQTSIFVRTRSTTAVVNSVVPA